MDGSKRSAHAIRVFQGKVGQYKNCDTEQPGFTGVGLEDESIKGYLYGYEFIAEDNFGDFDVNGFNEGDGDGSCDGEGEGSNDGDGD